MKTRLVHGLTDEAHFFNEGCQKLWEILCTNACSFGSMTFRFLMGISKPSEFTHKSFRTTSQVQYQVESQKGDICTRPIAWCGKRIDENAISYEEDLIRELLKLPASLNAAELQKLLSAAN